MLMWHRTPWLIDHGATLYFHHAPGWEGEPARARDRFLDQGATCCWRGARSCATWTKDWRRALGGGGDREILSWVPDAWLASHSPAVPAETRAAYVRYLRDRLQPPRPFLPEAAGARLRSPTTTPSSAWFRGWSAASRSTSA